MIPRSLVMCWLGLVLVGMCVGPVMATESSVYTILNTDYSGYADFKDIPTDPTDWFWNANAEPYGKGIQMWTLTGSEAELVMVLESSSWATVNEFGFYDITTLATQTIFGTGDIAGTVKSYGGTSGNSFPFPTFGFYLKAASGNYSWYSQHKLNADKYAHERVCSYTDGTINWYGLFWEDMPSSWFGCGDWYANDETKLPNWKSTETQMPYEADHNDLAIRLKLEGGFGQGDTPELPAGALLLLGMLPVAVGHAWRKYRKAT